MNFKQLTEETKRFVDKFPKKYSWDQKERFMSMVEEAGELANAILVKEEKKPKNRLHKGNSIPDAMCDLLFDLLILADIYGVDLDKEYLEMLKKLDKRIKEGWFEERGDGRMTR